MNVIFANSDLGDVFTAPNDLARIALNCATAAQVNACNYVPTDSVAYMVKGGIKFGLAHVRVAAQVAGLARLIGHAGANVDVYLVGGIAAQPQPAADVVNRFSGALWGTASGVTTLYGHVQKQYGFDARRTDNSGHVTGFVATVGRAGMIGTHSLLGCVGVLIVPAGTDVTMSKIHMHDAGTLPPIGNTGFDYLTTVAF